MRDQLSDVERVRIQDLLENKQARLTKAFRNQRLPAKEREALAEQILTNETLMDFNKREIRKNEQRQWAREDMRA